MLLIAFGVVVCALGEANLVIKGLLQQLVALLFEVRVVGVGRQGCGLVGKSDAAKCWPPHAVV